MHTTKICACFFRVVMPIFEPWKTMSPFALKHMNFKASLVPFKPPNLAKLSTISVVNLPKYMAPLNFNKLNKIETIFQLTITYVCKTLVVQGCHFVTIDGNDLCGLYISFHYMKNMCMFSAMVHPIVFDQCFFKWFSTFKIWKKV